MDSDCGCTAYVDRRTEKAPGRIFEDMIVARCERLEGALRLVEYAGEAGACPCCGGKPHMPHCELAAALKP